MPDVTATIVAEATPAGRGGLSVVRLSGDKSLEILRKLFSPRMTPAPWSSPRRLVLGEFLDSGGSVLDLGLAVYFEAPASFTGEDVVEFNLHGSPAVVLAVKRACIELGARPALPGEFSFRAVLNGRSGLIEAEAANEMASFETALQAKSGGIAAAGGLHSRAEALRQRVLELSAAWEARVEFPEDFPPCGGLARDELAVVRREVMELLDISHTSSPLRRGWRVALCGAVNVGKSSLFNAILQRERALVTPHPGTTRDILEETIDLRGLPLVLIDTAGVRESGDPVEKLGVERGLEAARSADGVLLLYSKETGWRREEESLAASLAGKVIGLVETKSDLARGASEAPQLGLTRFSLSNVTGEGFPPLMSHLADWALASLPGEAPVLLNERQRAALERASECLAGADGSLASGHTEEVALAFIGEAARAFDDLLGKKPPEYLYELIFSKFCIGK